jgi:SAM-dependent methyltransferase
MAQVVGLTGQVIGIDVSDAMLALGQRRCANIGGTGRLSFVKADATALPFPDAAFDAAVSIQVYEYVADLPNALAELYRVLRPGGRALILDTDWDSIVWHANDPERMGRLLDAWRARFADPHLPRTLGHQLRNAGFQVSPPEALVLLNPEYDAIPTASLMARSWPTMPSPEAASPVTRPTPGLRISANSGGTDSTSSA